jgi:hypothetical protein
MTRLRKRFAALLAASVAACAPAVSHPPVLVARGAASAAGANWAGLHNAERLRVGAPLLRWDEGLAAGAQRYANELAALGALRHSAKATRPGEGENLWMGTAGAFSPGQMVGGWASERQLFRPGIFPNVSSNGNWAAVGHYTQMIWRTTEKVGCAVGRSPRIDVLVCRYFPSGNVMGRAVP